MLDDKWVEGGGEAEEPAGGDSTGATSDSVSDSNNGNEGAAQDSDKEGSVSSDGSPEETDSSGTAGGTHSKKNFYKDLDRTLGRVLREEWEGLDGTKPRKWFSDRMGEGTYEKMFDEFLAGPHDDEWSRARQDRHGSLSKIAANARAIGYMDSMWRDLQSLYLTDEISSYIDERHAAGKWLYHEPEILEFLTPK